MTRPRHHTLLALATLALAAHAANPFTVTFRLGGQVIGPAAALAVVLPTADGTAATQQGSARAAAGPASSRLAEIWVTMPASATTQRLAALARATVAGHPTIGRCEIDAADAAGAIVRRYTIAGCFAKRVDALGADRRVALGYTAITHS